MVRIIDPDRSTARAALDAVRDGIPHTAEGQSSFKPTRTTAGSVLAGRGLSRFLIGSLLGHSQETEGNATDKFYMKVEAEGLRPVVETFDNWILNGHFQKTLIGEAVSDG